MYGIPSSLISDLGKLDRKPKKPQINTTPASLKNKPKSTSLQEIVQPAETPLPMKSPSMKSPMIGITSESSEEDKTTKLPKLGRKNTVTAPPPNWQASNANWNSSSKSNMLVN